MYENSAPVENPNLQTTETSASEHEESGLSRRTKEFEKTAFFEIYCQIREKLLNENDGMDSNLTERDLLDNKIILKKKNPSSFRFKKVTKRFFQKTAQFVSSKYKTGCSLDIFLYMFPFINTAHLYEKRSIFSDLIAGLSVGVAAIPMGISYALLAGLPPAHGLYNNLFYPLFYMFFGTSSKVCLGTSAIEAIMSAEAVEKVVGWDASPEEWLNASIGLTFFVGCILLMMYLLRLGFMTNFLADSIISGFSTGAAITIATTQLKDVLGIKTSRLPTIQTWIHLLVHLNETKLGCLLISLFGIGFLFIINYINKRWCWKYPIPGSLIMLIVFLCISYTFSLKEYGIPIVGDIPAGLPVPSAFNFDIKIAQSLFFQAVWYSILYFVIHVSIVKTLAFKHDETIDSNQELLACGVSSIFGSFFQCYAIATSVSRSSMASATGAKTIFWNISNISVVLLTTTLITPLLRLLPIPALSSVIIFCAAGMMHFNEGYKLLKLCSTDFLLWIGTFLGTILFGSMEGVTIGACLALLWILKKAAFPKIVTLGRIPGTTIYRNVCRFDLAKEIEGCKLLRFDASLNFINSSKLEDAVLKAAKINLCTFPRKKKRKDSSGI